MNVQKSCFSGVMFADTIRYDYRLSIIDYIADVRRSTDHAALAKNDIMCLITFKKIISCGVIFYCTVYFCTVESYTVFICQQLYLLLFGDHPLTLSLKA